MKWLPLLLVASLGLLFAGCGGESEPTLSVATCDSTQASIEAYNSARDAWDGMENSTGEIEAALTTLEADLETMRGEVTDPDQKTSIGRFSAAVAQLNEAVSEYNPDGFETPLALIVEYSPEVRTICESAQ